MIVPSAESIDALLNEISSKQIFDTMATNEYRVYKDCGQIKIVVKVDENSKPVRYSFFTFIFSYSFICVFKLFVPSDESFYYIIIC